MKHTLIVARMNPEDAGSVADVFRRSDEGELPRLLRVRERHLFRFHDIYMHLVTSQDGVESKIDGVRSRAEYKEVDEALRPFIAAYSPETWTGPRDAMATEFYSWRSDAADAGSEREAR